MISIIIPTLGKRPEMLKEALDSIEAQTIPDYEVIIVEDSDATYGNQARKINKGVQRSVGNHYMFMGDDDKLMPDFVEKMLQAFDYGEKSNQHFNIVTSFFQNFGDDTSVHGPAAFPLCSTVVSRELYDRTGGYDPEAGPGCDADFYFQCFENGGKLYVIPDILYLSRVHKDQFSLHADWSRYKPLIKEKYNGKYDNF